ncbi:MAG: hypothetical protein SFX18_20015 [Pirellulales bacterium]|nr:hypothetical protein [Pirellulales bacterium]
MGENLSRETFQPLLATPCTLVSPVRDNIESWSHELFPRRYAAKSLAISAIRKFPSTSAPFNPRV